jgi:spermidine synthase
VVTGLAIATGIAAFQVSSAGRTRPMRAAALAFVALWALAPAACSTRIPADLLEQGSGRLVDFREGRGANLAVLDRDDRLHLEIDRWWQGENRPNHQRIAAHLPALLHERPERVLVIGIGVGQTPAAFLQHEVATLDAVEIEPALPALIASYFEASWLDDPRVRVVIEDGHSFTAHSERRYDLISLELGQVFRPGVAAFYTEDFYRSARDRLRPGGILSQFLPLPFFTPEHFRRAIATFVAVFPESQLWYNKSELLLIGARDRRLAIEPARLERVVERAREDLRYTHWGGPDHWLERPGNWLGSFLAGPSGLSRLSDGARPYREVHPELDYAASAVSPLDTNELALSELLRAALDPVEDALAAPLAPSEMERALHVRERNLGDLVANALMRQLPALVAGGRLDEARAILERALAANPEKVGALRMLADAHLVDGRPEEAEQAYLAALAIEPADARAILGLAFTRHRMGRVDESLALYARGLRLRPHDAQARNNYGSALAEQDRFAEAEREFEEALRLRPGFADARRNLERVRGAREGAPGS